MVDIYVESNGTNQDIDITPVYLTWYWSQMVAGSVTDDPDWIWWLKPLFYAELSASQWFPTYDQPIPPGQAFYVTKNWTRETGYQRWVWQTAEGDYFSETDPAERNRIWDRTPIITQSIH